MVAGWMYLYLVSEYALTGWMYLYPFSADALKKDKKVKKKSEKEYNGRSASARRQAGRYA